MRVYKRTRKVGGKIRADKKYTVEFRDHLDTVRRLVAFSDGKQSNALAERIEKLVTWRRLGGKPDLMLQTWLVAASAELLAKLLEWDLVPSEMAGRDKPLSDHLADFKVNLLARGRGPDHCATVLARVTRLFDLCDFAFHGDIKHEKAETVLGQLRDKGMSQQTVNHYVRCAKQFTRWMVDKDRATTNPLSKLVCENVEADRRIERRELSADEITLLLIATRGGAVRQKLTGEQRAMLYTVALGTGLRASECASLTPRSFKLNAVPPVVNLAAAEEKNKKGSDLPIPADLVERLGKWLPSIKPDAPLWPGKWAEQKRAGAVLKADLKAARDAWLKEAEAFPEDLTLRTESDFLKEHDHDGKVADFHALRHTYLSRLGRSGAPAKVMQMLARHSTVELTLTRYTHANLVDLAGAVAKLPTLEATPAARPEALRATGTDPQLIPEKQNCDTEKGGPRYGPFLGTSGVISGHFEAFSEGENCPPFRPHENEKGSENTAFSEPSVERRGRDSLTAG